MCKVRNKHDGDAAPDAIYIGRSSCWGNPFRIGAHGDRTLVIARYEHWLRGQHALLRILDALRNRNLVCFCAPRPCHGDLLLWLAHADRELRIAWYRRRIVWDAAARSPRAA